MREDGPYLSLWDFINRVDTRIVGRAVMENLIRAGAFDLITPNRRQLMESLPGMFELAQRRSDDCHSQQLLGLEDLSEEEGPVLLEVDDYDLHTRMEMEKEATGLYISGHPFDKYEKEVLPYTTCSITDLSFWKSEDCTAVVAGILSGVQEKFTRKGDRMGILELEDLKEGMELQGIIRNVVDFGAFVDIGVHEDGLIHISELSTSYVKHPLDIVKVGDIVKVKVLSVDLQKKRISLSLKRTQQALQ